MINLEKRRVISSMLPHFGSFQEDPLSGTDSNEKLPIDKKIHILRSFFRSVVGPIFPDIFIANPYGVDQSTGGTLIYLFRDILRYILLSLMIPKCINILFVPFFRDNILQSSTCAIGSSS